MAEYPVLTEDDIPWGMVKVVRGKYRGRFGYYDDDEERHAIVYLAQNAGLPKFEDIRAFSRLGDYMSAGTYTLIPHRNLAPFDDAEESALAYARMAPAAVVGEAQSAAEVVNRLAECLKAWGFEGENLDADLQRLSKVLAASKILPFPPSGG